MEVGEIPLWEQHAEWWQQGYTDGADPEYEQQLSPLAVEWLTDAINIVDIGCGEGQLCRALITPERTIVGVDPTKAQVAMGKQRGGGPHYVQASAVALPVGTNWADAALACLVFEHIHELHAALSEVARVVRPGGTFVLLLNHPLTQAPDSAWIDDHILGEQYYRLGPYLQECSWIEQIAADVQLPYVHRPISSYVNGLIRHGFELLELIEPPPAAGYLAAASEYQHTAAIPRVLGILSRRHVHS